MGFGYFNFDSQEGGNLQPGSQSRPFIINTTMNSLKQLSVLASVLMCFIADISVIGILVNLLIGAPLVCRTTGRFMTSYEGEPLMNLLYEGRS